MSRRGGEVGVKVPMDKVGCDMAESGLEAVSASAMDGIGRMKRSKW